MKNYYCKTCKAHLNVDNHLVLAVKDEFNKRGLVFLSPELGDYNKKTNPNFSIKEGGKYQFYCPCCHKVLNDEENEDLVKLHMEELDKHYAIFFSSFAGEKATYKIDYESFEHLGIDSEKYKKYFDLKEEYKKYL